jgi:hypothetical protein
MHGRPASLGRSFEFAFSSLRVISQESAIHELIHRTIPLPGDLMNAFAKSSQDDDLRFSPGLFLSGLKLHKLNSIKIDRQKRIVDRSRQLSPISRFVPQEFVEGTQEPDIVDSEMNASPLGHDSLLSSGWSLPQLKIRRGPYMQIYTPPSCLLQAAPTNRAQQDVFRCPAGEALRPGAILNRGHGVRTHVYRAPQEACCDCALREQCAPPGARPARRRSITRIAEPPATTAFKAKMKTEEAQKIYAQRSQVAEFAHARIKERCGSCSLAATLGCFRFKYQFLHTFLPPSSPLAPQKPTAEQFLHRFKDRKG